jgi:hypothetical protein
MENFEYLKAFISPLENKKQKVRNWFYPVTENEIEDAENRLGIKFPSQLRNFYKKIGYGSLKVPHNAPPNYVSHYINRINSPRMLADIVLLGQESGNISEEALECMEQDDLPFFEVSDANSFLVMKLNKKKPNAIYSDTGSLIEENFNRFIWRLYYESPTYYENELASA